MGKLVFNIFIQASGLLLLLITQQQAYADRVTIVSDRWYPYNGIPNSPDPGYMIEIARYGLEQAGHSFNYQLMSWQHSINLVRKGEKNCIIGAYKSDAPDFVYSELHHAVDRVALYKRNNDPWQYENVDSLVDRGLGIIEGYAYFKDINNYIATMKNSAAIVESKGKYALENNLLKLIKGEIDTVIGSSTVIDQVLKKQQWQNQIEFAGYANETSKIYVACSPQHPNSSLYVKQISDGLEKLRTTGELQKILNKYYIADWQELSAVDN